MSTLNLGGGFLSFHIMGTFIFIYFIGVTDLCMD